MSDNLVVERASFWRESLKAWVPTLKAEWRWVAGFAIITTIAQIFVKLGIDTDALKNNPDMFKQHPEMVMRFALLGMIPLLLYIPAIYIFTVVYLRRVAAKNPPHMTLANFFYWFVQCCKKYFLICAPIFLWGICLGIGSVLNLPKAFAGIAVILSIPVLFYYMHIVLRLVLVSPIAIFRREPVIKNSWDITKGDCWRILGNLLLQLLILILALLIPFLVVAIIAYGIGKTSLPATILFALIQGVWQGMCTMTGVIFVCTVYRILLQERRQNAPVQPVQQ